MLSGFLLLAGGATLWALAHRPPAWYKPSPPDSQTRQLAEEVEYRLLEETHRIREPAESWSILIRDEQVNAWLAARLQPWAGHDSSLEWLSELGPAQVSIEPAGLTLAIADADDPSLVIQARIVFITENGRLALRVDQLSLGRLSIPGAGAAAADWLVSAWLNDQTDEESQAAREILLSRRSIDPVIVLDDGREIRVTGIRWQSDAAALTLTTTPPSSAGDQ